MAKTLETAVRLMTGALLMLELALVTACSLQPSPAAPTPAWAATATVQLIETATLPIAAPDTVAPPPPTETPQVALTPEEIDPYIEIGAAHSDLQVGEQITVTGKPIQLGLPYYYLYLRDEGVQDAPFLAQVTYENQFTAGEGASQVLELVSVQADMSQVVIVLRAKAPGMTTLSIQATGEVRLQDGAYSMSGMAAGDILISVRP